MAKCLSDLENRQKALEAQRSVVVNPVDAIAADLPYVVAVKTKLIAATVSDNTVFSH